MEAGDDSCVINKPFIKGTGKWMSLYKKQIAVNALNHLYKKTQHKKNSK
jgi:hypothetical protein